MYGKIKTLTVVCLLALCLCACKTLNSATVPQSEAVKTGILIEASNHTLTIEAPNGSTYSFVTDDSTELIGDGESLGDTVSVEFKGEYNENVLADKVKIIEKADEDVVVSAKEVDKSNKSDHPIKYITGVVKDASMHNITVEWNGKDYVILKDDNTTVEGEIIVGSTVRVYHEGDIADGVCAIDISVVADEITDKDIRYVTGKVVDASMNVIVIENGGHNYSILKDDNTKSDSISVGDTVRVYHKGSYSDGMTATSIIKQ